MLQDLRHSCEQDEGMAGYGWTAYDVRKGGMQIINDTGNKLDLTTQFAKVSDDRGSEKWALRVKGSLRANSRDRQKTTMIFYLGNEDSNSRIQCTKGDKINSSNGDVVCDGTMVGLRSFKLQIPGHRENSDSILGTSVSSSTVPADTIWQAKSIFTNQLKSDDSYEGMVADNPGEGNLHFMQINFKGDFTFDVLFSSNSTSAEMTSSSLMAGIQDALNTFNKRFQAVYTP